MTRKNDLTSVSLKHTHSSLEVDLVDDVVIPLLKLSTQYDRGVGFFTSGWLKEAARGLVAFVKNGGFRLVCHSFFSLMVKKYKK